MSRGLEAWMAELARLCLSAGRIGRCGAPVVVNPVSSARSALAANRGLGQPNRPSSTPSRSNFGPLETSKCVKSSRVQTSGKRTCCSMHSRGGLTVLDFYISIFNLVRTSSLPRTRTVSARSVYPGPLIRLGVGQCRLITAHPSPNSPGSPSITSLSLSLT